MSIDKGGPAFPMPASELAGAYEPHPGMTLRDYYVAIPLEFTNGEIPIKWAEFVMGEKEPPAKDIPKNMAWWITAEARYRVMRANTIIVAIRALDGNDE